MSPIVEAALRSWSLNPFLLAYFTFLVVSYWRGWAYLNRQLPSRFPRWRLGCFVGGVGVVYLAVASPLDAFASFLLLVHMVQHLLLTMVAPPLLLLGAPWLPILRGLPKGWVRDGFGPMLNSQLGSLLRRLLGNPFLAWGCFVLSMLIWHIPSLYDRALRYETWHAVEHFCFLLTGLLFWWPILLPWPGRQSWSRWWILPYMLSADLVNTLLAAVISFYDRPLYPSYVDMPRLWGIGVMEDQMAAGAIMWVPGSLAFLVPAFFITARLLSPKKGVRPSALRLSQEANVVSETEDVGSRSGGAPMIPGLGKDRSDTSQYDADKPQGKRLQGQAKPWLQVLARSPLRKVLQGLMLLLALAVIADGFFGPRVSAMNLAGVLPWTYWRGFSALALLTLGNVFCSLCPFTFFRDLSQRLFPKIKKRTWPKRFANKWLAILLLLTFLWAYEVFDLWDRPLATAGLIVGYFASILLIDTLFRKGTFCKYLCPIGQYHFAFSTVSSGEIKVHNPDICARCTTHDCLRGNANQGGCETALFLPSKVGNLDCTACLDCVRACPHDNIGIQSIIPSRDLVRTPFRSTLGYYLKRPDLAALLALFTSGAFVNAAAMTAPVQGWLLDASRQLGLAESLLASVFILCGAVLLPLALGYGAATLSRWVLPKAQSTRELLTTFAYGYLPLGASLWAAHFLFHLATGAFTILPVLQRILSDLNLSWEGLDNAPVTAPGFSGDWILNVQWALLELGFLASLYVLWKLSSRVYGPKRKAGFLLWAALAVLLFAAALWIVVQPMEMRGTQFAG